MQFIWVVIVVMLRHMLVAAVAMICTIISLDLFVLATIVIIIDYGLVVIAITIPASLFAVVPKCMVLVMGSAILGVKQLLQQQLLQQPHHVWVIN